MMEQRREDVAVRRERIRWILKRKGRDIYTVPPDATVYDAIARMAEKGVGALMVVSEGKLVGVISERDYARKVILKHLSSKDTMVREIMTCPVITVTIDHTVDQCMDIMTHHRVRHLPVMEGDKLAGVISIGDLVDNIITAQAETIEHLGNYINGRS